MRRIAFGGVRQETLADFQQFGNPCARLGGGEADRYEMALTQGLLKRVVELLRREFLALLQVDGHQPLIYFDHLVEDLRVCRCHRREVHRIAVRLEKAVGHRRAALCGQIQRQTLRPERIAHLLQHAGGIGVPTVDLVDDDEAAQLPLACEVHEALRDRVDGAGCAEDDRDRLDGLESGERAPQKVGISGRIDEIDVNGAVVDGADRGIEGVLQALFLRIEVGHCRSALQAALTANRACAQQQRFHEQRLAGAGRTYQCDVTNALRRISHGGTSRGLAGRYFAPLYERTQGGAI